MQCSINFLISVYNLCRPVKKEALVWALTNCSTAIIAEGPRTVATAQLARTNPHHFFYYYWHCTIKHTVALYRSIPLAVLQRQSTPTKDRQKKILQKMLHIAGERNSVCKKREKECSLNSKLPCLKVQH